jgi:hypothetical protein
VNRLDGRGCRFDQSGKSGTLEGDIISESTSVSSAGEAACLFGQAGQVFTGWSLKHGIQD